MTDNKRDIKKTTEQDGQDDAVVILRFFDWAEKYTPLKTFWDKQNELNIQNGSENYPYDYFKETAKRKLLECIAQAI